MDLRRIRDAIVSIVEKVVSIYKTQTEAIGEDWKESRRIVDRHIKRKDPGIMEELEKHKELLKA